MSEDLPIGWVRRPLRELADISGGLMKGKKRSGGESLREVPYLRVANVQRGSLDLSEVKLIEATEAEIQQLRLLRGDVLFNEGGDRDKLGRGCVWNAELPECINQNHVFRARVRDGLALPQWISMFGNSDAAQAYFLASGKQTTNLASINMTALGGLPVPTPSLAEQRRIVAKLEALQSRSGRARDALDAVPPLLEKLRQSILAAAFRGDLTADWRAQNPNPEPASALLARIRTERRKKWEEAELAKLKAKGKAPTDDKWTSRYEEPEPVEIAALPELPEGWCWAPLPMLGELARGKSKHRPRNDPALFGDSMPFIQTGEVARSRGRIESYSAMYSELGVAQSRIFRRGTVCITIAANIAETGVLGFDACFPDSVVGFVADSGDELSVYVELFLRTARADLKRFAPATAQANINLEILSQVAVPIPPPDERRLLVERVARALDRAVQAEATLENTIGRLLELERSTLAKAFRGELVPQDPNDEPADITLSQTSAEPATSRSPRPRRAKAAE